MGFISALVAMLRAVPVLERLVLQVADAVKEAKAKNRYEAKLDHINAAMRNHGLPYGARVQQRKEVNSAPPISKSSVSRTGLYEKRDENNS